MLLTKLHIPSPGSNLVRRTDLIERLNSGLKKKLILVSAPAGFGKTTLLCDWISHEQIPAAWVSLDKRDNEAVEFLDYLIAGLQTIDKEIGIRARSLIKSPNSPDLESILSLVLNDLMSSDLSFVLILDDFHVIQSLEIVEAMKFILNNQPDNLSLVVSSRSDPPLSLSRLRSQNELEEFRSSDLSFSSSETFTFFNRKLKLGLSTTDVELLEAKTEGWIAGLQLSALSMRDRKDNTEFIRKLAGDNRYIMDYLLEEVLNMQSEEIKHFLIQTSILEQVSGSLADFLLNTSNSQEILEQLERSNMFIIPLDEERKCYRYHHLFADLLMQRLKQENQELIKDLHAKASEWYAENGFISFAIEHAIEAGNHERAMEFLDDTVEDLWKNGQHSTIRRLGDLLAEDSFLCNPNFCLYYAWILNSAGDLDKALKVLLVAEEKVLKDLPDHQKLYGKISVAFTYLLSSSRNTEKIFHYCEQAKIHLTNEDPLWHSWAWLSYGVACVYTDRLKESTEAFEKAFNYGKESGNLYIMSTAVSRLVYGQMRMGNYKYSYKKCKELFAFLDNSGYSDLAKKDWSNSGLFSIYGYIHYMWNRMEDALSMAQLGFELSHKGNDIVSQIFSTLFYTWILLFRGDKIRAESLIVKLDLSLHEKSLFATLPFSLTGQFIKIYIVFNKLDRAGELIKTMELSIDKDISYLDEMAYISYARYLIEMEEYSEAEILLKKLEILGEPGERIESLVEIKILYGILHNILDNEQLAKEYISMSLQLAEKENLMIFFVEEGGRIGKLLGDILSDPPEKQTLALRKFTESIILALEKKKKGSQDFYMDPLSTREIEVLKLMVEDLSNKEISDKLYVSVNTIKTHAKNIYLKLEVDNRSKAVVKAKELELI